ncbi:hypothetical protein [Novosphingobium sp.]|uniref:hypothetical protein n=1 Tax=Novosphingobium sp. TaxID=1874826 RepID=UPI003B517A8A
MTPNDHLSRLATLVERCEYPAFDFVTGMDGDQEAPQYWLRIECPGGFCTKTGEPMDWCGRKWRLSQHMTDGEVVFTVFKALITALEHEAREMFKFDGEAVADSHIDIHALVAFLKTPGSRKTRGRVNA